MIELVREGVIPNTHNKKYIIDSTDELSQLEVDFGNEAYCIADKTTYICNGSGEYVEKSSGGGGGGGSDLPPVTSADDGSFLRVEDGAWVKDEGEDVARTDGTYENLTAGAAEELIATEGLNDHLPYLFRRTAGRYYTSDLKKEQLIGGTIVLNQKIYNGDFALQDEVEWSAYNCSTAVVNGQLLVTTGSSNNGYSLTYQGGETAAGHVYFVSARLIAPRSCTGTIMIGSDSLSFGLSANTPSTPHCVLKSADNYLARISISWNRNHLQAGDVIYIDYIQCIDLTLMLGQTLSNAIYNYGWADKIINDIHLISPNQYHPFNTGSLLSVKPVAQINRGVNLLQPADNAGLSVAILPVGSNKGYQIAGPYSTIYYTDEYGNTQTIIPSADGYFNIYDNGITDRITLYVTETSNDTWLHIAWDGRYPRDFEGYKEDRISLVGKRVKRNYGCVDLGELDWEVRDDGLFSTCLVLSRPQQNPQESAPIIAADYTTVAFAGFRLDRTQQMALSGQMLYVSDYRYSTLEEFKAGTAGNSLIYALDEPFYEVVDEDTEFRGTLRASGSGYSQQIYYDGDSVDLGNKLWCDRWGTEEWVDNRAISMPCGHNTLYTENLRDKLEYLPSWPMYDEGDYYRIQIGANHMQLVPDNSAKIGRIYLEPTEASGEYEASETNESILEGVSRGYIMDVSFTLPGYDGGRFDALLTSGAIVEEMGYSTFQIQTINFDANEMVVFYADPEPDNTTWHLRTYDLNAEQIDVDYASLVAMRNGGNLVPGKKYRITDYETIINGTYDLSDFGAQGYLHYARSVENDFFDIIVTADDASHLNENARACRREGSTYAPDAKIESWEIKYCLDNDTNRFAWAHSDGKGVVYYMKDEFGNEAGYDFKNIQFIRYGLAESQHHPVGISYSYELIHDENEGCYGRYGTPFHLFQALQAYASAGTYVNPFSIDDGGNPLTYYDYDFAVGAAILGAIQSDEVDDTYLSTFDAGWYYTFDFAGEDASVHENTGYYCRQNSIGACCDAALAFVADKFDTYGLPCNVWMCFFPTSNIQDNKLDEDCFYNTFGTNSWRNHLGKLSAMNCIGEGCYDLHLGNRCTGNIFEKSCYYDVLGDECKYNIFHYSFTDSTLGAECERNYFCSSTHRNDLGVDCDNNVFYNNCADNELSSDCDQNVLGYGSIGNKFFYSSEIHLTDAPVSYGCEYCIFSNCTYILIVSSSIHLTFINVANSRLLSNSANSTFSDCNYLYLGSAEYSTFRCLERVGFGDPQEEYDGNVVTSNIQNLQYVNFEHSGIANVSTYGAVILANIPDTIDLNTYIYEIRGATVADTGKATIITKVAFGNESGTSTTDGGNTWS